MGEPHAGSDSDGTSHTGVLPYATFERVEPYDPFAIAAAVSAAMFFGTPVVAIVTSRGILALLMPVFALGAVALGICAYRRRPTPGSPSHRLATSALWFGGIELLLVGAFILILPSVGAPKERAQRVKCASNLRQIGQALMAYANENRGQCPPSLHLLLLDDNLKNYNFVCPSSGHEPAPGNTPEERMRNLRDHPEHCSYVYLAPALSMDKLPAEQVIAYERSGNHPDDGMNVLYGDGHVEWMAKADAGHIVAELSAGRNPPQPRPDTSTR